MVGGPPVKALPSLPGRARAGKEDKAGGGGGCCVFPQRKEGEAGCEP